MPNNSWKKDKILTGVVKILMDKQIPVNFVNYNHEHMGNYVQAWLDENYGFGKYGIAVVNDLNELLWTSYGYWACANVLMIHKRGDWYFPIKTSRTLKPVQITFM